MMVQWNLESWLFLFPLGREPRSLSPTSIAVGSLQYGQRNCPENIIERATRNR